MLWQATECWQWWIRIASPLMMQNAGRLYCLQAENCPRDRHLHQRLRPTVLRAPPQNAGRQNGRWQELKAANLTSILAPARLVMALDLGAEPTQVQTISDSSFRSMLAPLSGSLKTSSRNIVLRKRVRWRYVLGHVGKRANTDKQKQTPAVHDKF